MYSSRSFHGLSVSQLTRTSFDIQNDHASAFETLVAQCLRRLDLILVYQVRESVLVELSEPPVPVQYSSGEEPSIGRNVAEFMQICSTSEE
jgi:hypothetical protein